MDAKCRVLQAAKYSGKLSTAGNNPPKTGRQSGAFDKGKSAFSGIYREENAPDRRGIFNLPY